MEATPFLRRFLAAALAVAFMGAVAAPALAGQVAEVFYLEGASETPGRYFASGDSLRLDVRPPGPGGSRGQGSIIVHLKKKRWYWLEHGKKQYQQLPLKPGQIPGFWLLAEARRQARDLGPCKVSGRQCRKYLLPGPAGNYFLWISPLTPWPLRIFGGPLFMELRHLESKRLKASLFKVPKDYRQQDGLIKPALP